jgi:hypothetical protein
MIIEQNKANDNAQCAADISNVREVSGFDGKIFAQSTRRDRNFIPVTAAKVMMKVRLKKIINFANFFTILDYHGRNTRARVFMTFYALNLSITAGIR